MLGVAVDGQFVFVLFALLASQLAPVLKKLRGNVRCTCRRPIQNRQHGDGGLTPILRPVVDSGMPPSGIAAVLQWKQRVAVLEYSDFGMHALFKDGRSGREPGKSTTDDCD